MANGVKGVKEARHDLIPGFPVHMLSKVYGHGTKKYADRNWEMGYEWGKSYAAAQRHMLAFWNGESIDAESGLPHLAHAMWHMTVLMEFERLGIGIDDRSKVTAAELDSELLNEQEIKDAKPGTDWKPFDKKFGGIAGSGKSTPQNPDKFTTWNGGGGEDITLDESSSWGRTSEIFKGD